MSRRTKVESPKFLPNSKLQSVKVPADRKYIVASYDNGYIVWSQGSGKHRVRYGLDCMGFDNWREAAECFGNSVAHLEECNGNLER